MKAYAAEFFGTFWLVFGGCGSAGMAGMAFMTKGQLLTGHAHRAGERVVIPLVAGRSLNLAVSAAMAIGEAVRQVG